MGYLAVLFHNNQTVSSGSTAAHLEHLGFRYLSLRTGSLARRRTRGRGVGENCLTFTKNSDHVFTFLYTFLAFHTN